MANTQFRTLHDFDGIGQTWEDINIPARCWRLPPPHTNAVVGVGAPPPPPAVDRTSAAPSLRGREATARGAPRRGQQSTTAPAPLPPTQCRYRHHRRRPAAAVERAVCPLRHRRARLPRGAPAPAPATRALPRAGPGRAALRRRRRGGRGGDVGAPAATGGVVAPRARACHRRRGGCGSRLRAGAAAAGTRRPSGKRGRHGRADGGGGAAAAARSGGGGGPRWARVDLRATRSQRSAPARAPTPTSGGGTRPRCPAWAVHLGRVAAIAWPSAALVRRGEEVTAAAVC